MEEFGADTNPRKVSEAVRNNGTFNWAGKDYILLTEVRFIEPYKYKHGSKESGKAWNEVASGVNQHDGFKIQPRNQRSVRDRFNKLIADFRAKMRKEENESGTSPEPLNSVEQLLQEIDERITSKDAETSSEKDQEKQKKERAKAMMARDHAMTTWSKSANVGQSDSDEDNDKENNNKKTRKRKRRRGNDVLSYLEAKSSCEREVKKEELTLRREELALHQKQFENQMLLHQQQLQQNLSQQQQQYSLQQQQMQQQAQAQQQTQNLILALLQNLVPGQK